MKITAINPLGSGVYSVSGSDLSPFHHTVDLRAFSGNGSCTCPVFTDCCAFLLEKQRGAKRWRCDHLLSVRAWVMENEWPTLFEQTEKIIDFAPFNCGSAAGGSSPTHSGGVTDL